MSAARPEEAAPEEAAAAQRAPPPPPQQQQQPPRQRAAPPPLPRLAVVSGIPAAGSSALLGAANVARTPPLHRFAAAAAQPHEPQQRAYAHHQQLQQTPSAAAEAALSAVPMTNAQLDAVHGLIFGALHAAFQGSQYMERRWGPLPTCLALSQLCSVSARSRQLIWQRQRVPSIAWVLAHPRQDMWPVRNFPAGYFERAFASALSCLMSLAQDGHLLGAVPSLLNLITNMLEIHSTSTPICRAALGLADTVVRQEQARALQALSPSALAERRRCVAVLRVDHGSHAFERPLFEALHNHGWQHRMVGRRRRGRLLRLMSSAEADIAEDMEACSLLLVLSRPRRWNHSRQNLNFPLHYACFLKMPILVVNDNNGGHGGSTGSSGSVASSGSGGSSGSINVTVGDAAAGAAVLSANGAVPLAAAANATPSQTEGLSVAVEALLQGLAPLTSRPVMMISATPDADGAGRVVEEMRRAVYGDREAEAAADEAMAMMKRAAQLRRKSRKAAAGAEEEDEDEDDAACGALTRATAELVL